MRIYLSGSLRKAIPSLETEFRYVAKIARSLDRDIRVRGLYVWGRRSRYSDCFGGTCWNDTYTLPPRHIMYAREIVEHPSGKITFSVGHETTFEERVRLFAHELRHVGQMHRGKQKHGYLTFEHMTGHEAEADARDFEEKVVKRI